MTATKWEHVNNWRDAERYRLGPGEPCFLDADPRRVYWVVGVLADDELEAVALAAIDDRDLVAPTDAAGIVEAVNDGRLSTVRICRDRALPLPAGVWREIDRDEVRR